MFCCGLHPKTPELHLVLLFEVTHHVVHPVNTHKTVWVDTNNTRYENQASLTWATMIRLLVNGLNVGWYVNGDCHLPVPQNNPVRLGGIPFLFSHLERCIKSRSRRQSSIYWWSVLWAFNLIHSRALLAAISSQLHVHCRHHQELLLLSGFSTLNQP